MGSSKQITGKMLAMMFVSHARPFTAWSAVKFGVLDLGAASARSG
jgi:hypothetical protein